VFAPRDTMANALQVVSDVLPMTYAYDGLSRLATGEPATRPLSLEL